MFFQIATKVFLNLKASNSGELSCCGKCLLCLNLTKLIEESFKESCQYFVDGQVTFTYITLNSKV